MGISDILVEEPSAARVSSITCSRDLVGTKRDHYNVFSDTHTTHTHTHPKAALQLLFPTTLLIS